MSLPLDVLQGRKKLCHLIASLPANAALDRVAKTLASALDEWRTVREASPVQETNANDGDPVTPINDGVTPLMIACDKAQLNCLEYMTTQNERGALDILFGTPLDTSSPDICGGNSALHYAASSGCKGAIDILTCLLWRGVDHDSATSVGCMLQLCLTNAHGDTPLMMAAAEGHSDFLQHWVQCFYDCARDSHLLRADATGLIQVVFDKTNDSGDSALLLACDRGSVAVVDYLIRQVGVPTTDRDLIKATETQKRLDTVLRHGASSQREDELRMCQQKIKHCIALLTVALERKARQTMEELLSEEAAADRTREFQHGNSKKKKTNRKQKKKRPTIAEDRSSMEDSGTSIESSIVPSESSIQAGSVEEAPMEQDATSDDDCDESVEDQARRATSGPIPERSIDTLLRGRYREKPDQSVDAMMDALCVDASMLLLSSHGMAMHLSPAQLEVIEAVLQKQIEALEEARDIQARLRINQSQ